MKVITEENIEAFRLNDNYTGHQLEVVYDLIDVMQEIDTLTVSKLRPMSEEPEVPANKMSAYVLLYTAGMSVPRIARFDLHNGFDSDAKRDGVGWLYLPIYK